MFLALHHHHPSILMILTYFRTFPPVQLSWIVNEQVPSGITRHYSIRRHRMKIMESPRRRRTNLKSQRRQGSLGLASTDSLGFIYNVFTLDTSHKSRNPPLSIALKPDRADLENSRRDCARSYQRSALRRGIFMSKANIEIPSIQHNPDGIRRESSRRWSIGEIAC